MQKQPFFKYISCKNLFNKSFTEIQASSNAINNLLKIIVFSLENIENSQIFQFNGQKLSQRKSCRYPRDKHKNLRFYEKCNCINLQAGQKWCNIIAACTLNFPQVLAPYFEVEVMLRGDGSPHTYGHESQLHSEPHPAMTSWHMIHGCARHHKITRHVQEWTPKNISCSVIIF